MTVRAAHITLRDLRRDLDPLSAMREVANRGQFSRASSVIEVEDDRIGRAAVHAWVLSQVRDEPQSLTAPRNRTPESWPL
jgi:hypothetical protein